MLSLLKRALPGAGLLFACTVAAAQATLAPPPPQEIATVVKVTPLPWFDRMAQGVRAFGQSTEGVRARQYGPARAEPALQLRLLEDLLREQPPQALAIVPTDPAAVEDVARRAMAKGIVVVTHEADNLVNTQADLEAFDNEAFGAALNERLAACMGGQGQWTSFVGTRGSRTHRRWIDGAVANAAKHPGLALIEPLNESNDDAEQAYQRARELLQRHPGLRGFQGTASSDVIGIGRAVLEAGRAGQVCVVGTGLPQRSRVLLEAGAIQAIGFWDPRDAGLALNRLAHRLLQGQALKDGMDLGVPGYRQVRVRPGAGRGVVVTGEAAVIVDREGARDHDF
jgi:simple sugar transport system substrate-binding protein